MTIDSTKPQELDEVPSEGVASKLIDSLPTYIITVLVAVMCSLLLSWGLWHKGSMGGNSTYVSFDPVKFGNAQRAIASGLLGTESASQGDAAVMLTKVSKQAEAMIKKVAGEGHVVLVKQAVVAGNIYDITDDVLVALGLPTNVPSVDPTRFLFDVAPTDLSFSLMGQISENKVNSKKPSQTSATDKNQKVLP